MMRVMGLQGVALICFSWCRIPSRLSLYAGSCVLRRAVNNYGFGN